MRMEITNEKVNRLLHRTELECEMKFVDSTPTREELLKEIASKKHVDEKLIVIDSIRQEYGKKEASCFVKVYESEKSRLLVEGKQKPKTKKKKEEDAPAAPAEAATEAAPEGEKPAEAPAEETEKPAEAASEAPAEEKPAEEKPAEEKPEQPAEEKKE